MLTAPIRYSPDLEQVQDNDAETDASLEKSFDHILQTTAKHYGRPVRAVHAKAHGRARRRAYRQSSQFRVAMQRGCPVAHAEEAAE